MAWRTWFSHKLTSRGGWVVVITFVLASLTIVTIGALPSPPPLVIIELETETLLQSVRRPDTSSIAMTEATLRLRSGAELSELCSIVASRGGFSGIVRPAEEALVRYRWSPGGIAITVAAPEDRRTVLIGADEERCEMPPQDDLNIILPKPDARDPTWRLPIAGPAAAGGEFGVPTLPGQDGGRDMTFLRSGTVKVFGRSGWPFGRGELYAVEPEGFIIPAGSRVASSGNIAAGRDEAGASWYGVAEYSSNGFKVSATAETSRLLLFRPGASSQEETFATGLLARIFSDPNVAFISIAFLVTSVIGQVVSGWVGTWRERPCEDKPPPRKQPAPPRRSARKRVPGGGR